VHDEQISEQAKGKRRPEMRPVIANFDEETSALPSECLPLSPRDTGGREEGSHADTLRGNKAAATPRGFREVAGGWEGEHRDLGGRRE